MSKRPLWPVLVALAAASDGGERDRAPVSSAPPPPRAEFLVAAGDSTVWVRATPAGIRRRGSSLLLARYGGDFYEVYTADDDHSFYDALFVGQRVYRRDLVTGDSALVYRDSIVPEAERRWARMHPDASPLLPDEDASEHPSSSATADVSLLDIHEGYLSIEHRTDVDVGGVRHLHRTVRRVIDLRGRHDATVGQLFGDGAGRRILGEARRLFAAARDSIRDARDPLAEPAQEAVGELAFDPRSFSIGDDAGAPAVSFLVPATGELATGTALPLSPITTSPPAWWSDVAATLPSARDSVADAWTGGSYMVRARYDTAGEGAALVLADTQGREWPLGRVPAPVRHVLWLDTPPLDSTRRAALERAFDDAVLYDDAARIASLRRHEGPRVALARRGRAAGARLLPVRQTRTHTKRTRHAPA